MRKQHLVESLGGNDTLRVCSDLCGLHAQVMSSAEFTVWARTEGLGRTAVQDALWQDRALVKLWAMRGTLHLVRANEFAIYTAALRTYDHYRKPQWMKYFDTTPKELDHMLAAIQEVLVDNFMTREDLADAVHRKTRSKKLGDHLRASWGSFLKPSSFRGDLCFGPSEGRNVTFTSPSSWIGPFERLDPQASLQEVIRRFIRTYGPVSREDIARWWSGISAAGASRMLSEMNDVVAVDVEGARAYVVEDDVEGMLKERPSKTVRLLPAFDQFIITAPRNTPQVLDPALKARVYRKAAWISQVLLVDGRMLGVWKHERKGSRVDIAIEPFEEPTAWVKKRAEREAKRFAEFLAADPSISWEPGVA